MKFINWRKQ